MYVNYFDRKVKTREEDSTIGIILCKKKNSALVPHHAPQGRQHPGPRIRTLPSE
jgi:hypothetical protein